MTNRELIINCVLLDVHVLIPVYEYCKILELSSEKPYSLLGPDCSKSKFFWLKTVVQIS